MARRAWVYALLFSWVFLLQGCLTYSLHPIAKTEESQFRPELLGKWMEEGGREGYFVAKGKDGTYEVKKIGRKNVLVGLLVNLGGVDYLDLSPLAPTRDALNIPVHLIVKLKLEGDQLQVTSLDTDWIQASLKKEKYRIAHAQADDDLLLTAPRVELQAFLTRLAHQPKAFTSESVVFVKR